MAKKTDDLGDVIHTADNLKTILALVREYFGQDRTAHPTKCDVPGVETWELRTPSGGVVTMTYIFKRWEVFHFAFKPIKK